MTVAGGGHRRGRRPGDCGDDAHRTPSLTTIAAWLLLGAWWVTLGSGVAAGAASAPPASSDLPSPRVIAVEPPRLRAGGAAVSVTVRGQHFRPDSVVRLGDMPVPTQYRSGEELGATIPAPLLAKPNTLVLTVGTPGSGRGTSDPVSLPVLAAQPGRFVVFTSNRRDGRNHVFLLDRESGRLDPLEEANSQNGSDGYPSISGDGRFIVFQTDRNRGQADVVLFDREGRTLDPLPELNHPTAFDGFPHLSPDGRFIVFETDRLNGRPKVFLFDRQTRILSELIQANEPTADDGLAAISN